MPFAPGNGDLTHGARPVDSSLPGEEEGYSHGPVALTAPNMDEDALDGASLLDTSLGARPKRERRKDCCVCCGMRYVGFSPLRPPRRLRLAVMLMDCPIFLPFPSLSGNMRRAFVTMQLRPVLEGFRHRLLDIRRVAGDQAGDMGDHGASLDCGLRAGESGS